MKRRTTVKLEEGTAANLAKLAQHLGILHTRGVGAPLGLGSTSRLLDYIGHLVQAEGVAAVAARLKGEADV